MSIRGTTHQVRIAPPVIKTSMRFIAVSIATIDINDIPMAVLKAILTLICFNKIHVSNAIEVSSPLIIASAMICQTGQLSAVN